jgi:predicted AAA+ superfamily ATPase
MIHRKIEDLAHERIGETPVLLLQGPRAVGKSTLIQNLSEQYNSGLIDFDNQDIRELFDRNKSAFLPNLSTIFIDEYQKAPAILGTIKTRLNRSSAPGQFVLTGSSSFDALPTGTEALTGRLDRLEILPFSQAEIENSSNNLIERLVKDIKEILRNLNLYRTKTNRTEYLRRLALGGFPLPFMIERNSQRIRWFRNYIDYLVNRDIPEISKLHQISEIKTLIKRLTRSNAGVLNVSNVCQDTGIKYSTALSYISLLEKVFLFYRLAPSEKVQTSRLANRPKIHFVDSGIATHLLGFNDNSIHQIDHRTAEHIGKLTETFVVNEIIKLSQLVPEIEQICYWRTRDFDEIDLVLELESGQLIACEVKAGTSIRGSDFRSIEKYQKLAGDRLLCGIVFYQGEVVVPYNKDTNLFWLPIDLLWKDA